MIKLQALIKFARKPARLNPEDYRGNPQAYKEDKARATRQLREFTKLARKAQKLQVPDEYFTSAALGSRLKWNEENKSFYYLVGSYYPVEFRNAAKNALEAALFYFERKQP